MRGAGFEPADLRLKRIFLYFFLYFFEHGRQVFDPKRRYFVMAVNVRYLIGPLTGCSACGVPRNPGFVAPGYEARPETVKTRFPFVGIIHPAGAEKHAEFFYDRRFMRSIGAYEVTFTRKDGTAAPDESVSLPRGEIGQFWPGCVGSSLQG